jgi:hypothetical protein
MAHGEPTWQLGTSECWANCSLVDGWQGLLLNRRATISTYSSVECEKFPICLRTLPSVLSNANMVLPKLRCVQFGVVFIDLVREITPGKQSPAATYTTLNTPAPPNYAPLCCASNRMLSNTVLYVNWRWLTSSLLIRSLHYTLAPKKLSSRAPHVTSGSQSSSDPPNFRRRALRSRRALQRVRPSNCDGCNTHTTTPFFL